MNLGEAGKKLIKSFEGCQLTAYKAVPTEKYWTIGYGHSGPDVKQGMTITKEQAETLFNQDIKRFVGYVNALNMKLNQNQFDALVSFAYNCGNKNLIELCKSKNVNTIAKTIRLYNKSKGKVLKGLVRRRQAEYELFIAPVKEELTMSQYQELKKEIDELKQLLNKKLDKPSNYDSKTPGFGNDEWNEVISEGYFDGSRPNNFMTRLEGGIITKRITNNVRQFITDPIEERLKKIEEQLK